jgi:SPP1 family phage portal protein
MLTLSTAILRALAGLKANGGVPTSAMLIDLIDAHKADRDAMLALYKRYRGDRDGVPIYDRTFEYATTKVNAQLANDFMGDIIDTKTGYLMGRPITYGLDRERYARQWAQPSLIGRLMGRKPEPVAATESPDYDKHGAVLQDFLLRNNVADLDAETSKMASVAGYGARLLYIQAGEGSERVMAIPPWEVVFVTAGSIAEADYALRYYETEVLEGGAWVEVTRAEWYDAANVWSFTRSAAGQGFVLDVVPRPSPQPHLFGVCPLIGFANNDELQGDVTKVLPLIDAYNNALSDVASEITQFRLAYLLLVGVEMTAEQIEKARKTGAVEIPPAESGQEHDVRFLTKTLAGDILENHLDRLEQNILRFARSVNFGDEAFAGNLSGVALKFKLFGLETKCVTSERKFVAASRRMFQVLAGPWAAKGAAIDYMAITMQFTRNFPLNLADEALTTAALKGTVSEKTRLGLLSFVEDPEKELAQMQAEDEERVDLDKTPTDEGGAGERDEGKPKEPTQ